jgi:hypothetical protein
MIIIKGSNSAHKIDLSAKPLIVRKVENFNQNQAAQTGISAD